MIVRPVVRAIRVAYNKVIDRATGSTSEGETAAV
jgi:hypothetical protein